MDYQNDAIVEFGLMSPTNWPIVYSALHFTAYRVHSYSQIDKWYISGLSTFIPFCRNSVPLMDDITRTISLVVTALLHLNRRRRLAGDVIQNTGHYTS